MDFNASGSFNFHLILSDIFARFYMHLDRLTGIGKTPNQCNDRDETVDYTSGKLYHKLYRNYCTKRGSRLLVIGYFA